MKLTCAQMDVLITFYIDGELSKSLKSGVEEHLKICSACRAKYDIIKTMLCDINSSLNNNTEIGSQKDEYRTKTTSQQYHVFRNDLSAYLDNELSQDDNIKIKKLAISNAQARKDLQDSYNIRKLMNESFRKTKNELKPDFTKHILNSLDIDDETIMLNFHPAIKWTIIICFSIITLCTISLFIFGI